MYLSGFSQENRSHIKYIRGDLIQAVGCTGVGAWHSKGNGGTAELMNCWEELPPLGLGNHWEQQPATEKEWLLQLHLGSWKQHSTIESLPKGEAKRERVRDRGRTIACPFPLPSGLPSIFMGKLYGSQLLKGPRSYRVAHRGGLRMRGSRQKINTFRQLTNT